MSARRTNRAMPQPQSQPQQSAMQSSYGQQQQYSQQIPPPYPPSMSQQAQQVTPQKAIELIIPRLVALEQKLSSTTDTGYQQDNTEVMTALAECQQNINLLATENAELKDMLLKLQTFTMSVNKQLFDKLNVTPAV